MAWLKRMVGAGLLCIGCAHWAFGQADTQNPAADDLAQREINLLKLRLAQEKQQRETEQVGRIVYQTALEVAAIRGFEILDVVNYQPLTAAKLEEILIKSIETQYPGAALRHYIWVNRLFSALPPDIDLIEFMKDLTTEQVAGLYDPLGKELYVKTDFKLDTPLGHMILAHEICHALQDQNSPLTELGVDDADNADRAMAILSIAEGDATLLMGEHLARYGNAFGLLADMPKMMLMDQQKLNNAPVAIQRSLLFPYLEGMNFFQALSGRTRQNPQRQTSAVAAVGEQSLWRQEVFFAPPESTEQILHPEKYLARELPVEVRLPAYAWNNLLTSSTSILGEFGTSVLLEPLLGRERAQAAAAGWAGDRILVGELRSAERTTTGPMTLYWQTMWDTARDADEFAEALEDVLTTRYAGGLRWRAQTGEASGPGRGAGAAERVTRSREGRAHGSELTILQPEPRTVVLRGRWTELP